MGSTLGAVLFLIVALAGVVVEHEPRPRLGRHHDHGSGDLDGATLGAGDLVLRGQVVGLLVHALDEPSLDLPVELLGPRHRTLEPRGEVTGEVLEVVLVAAQEVGARAIEVLARDYGHDLDAMAAAITPAKASVAGSSGRAACCISN